MSDYKHWLRTFDHDDEEKAATDALDDLGRLNQVARSLLLPILAEAILMVRRDDARTVERQFDLSRVFSGETTLDQRATRLSQSFVLGDGRRVTWDEATEEDHRARIEYLSVHVRGVLETISRHEEAIGLIREHGVSCLGEIEVAA